MGVFLPVQRQIARRLAYSARPDTGRFAGQGLSANLSLGRGPGPLTSLRSRGAHPPPGRSDLSPVRPPHFAAFSGKIAYWQQLAYLASVFDLAGKNRWHFPVAWCLLGSEQSTRDEENLTCADNGHILSDLPSGWPLLRCLARVATTWAGKARPATRMSRRTPTSCLAQPSPWPRTSQNVAATPRAAKARLRAHPRFTWTVLAPCAGGPFACRSAMADTETRRRKGQTCSTRS